MRCREKATGLPYYGTRMSREYSSYSAYESMRDESDQDMTYEVAKGLYQQIRRRGDRERVRINSNPRPVTPQPTLTHSQHTCHGQVKQVELSLR